MTLDEAIKQVDEVTKENESNAHVYEDAMVFKQAIKHNVETKYCEESMNECVKCAEEYRQLAEWLKELKTYREFADLLVKAVLGAYWEESADFYAEVICRKLTKLGKLKVVDNKYVEVNADE